MYNFTTSEYPEAQEAQQQGTGGNLLSSGGGRRDANDFRSHENGEQNPQNQTAREAKNLSAICC
jgi:hypothetical protein